MSCSSPGAQGKHGNIDRLLEVVSSGESLLGTIEKAVPAAEPSL